MTNRRLGKFRFGDYNSSWISMVILLSFSSASAIMELPYLLIIFPTLYALIWLGAILFPYCEQFSINSDSIFVRKGRHTRTIHLPTDLTIIVSYADVCPPLSIRTTLGNQTHVLKDKFAVSILQKIPVDVALETLHQHHIPKYTTSSIRTAFDDHRYIYSFVCDQLLFDALVDSKKCLLIIPESLSKVMTFESIAEKVYIDTAH